MDLIPTFRTYWIGNPKTSLMKKVLLSDFPEGTNGPVAIFGSGVSGNAAQKLLRSKGRDCEVFDQRNRVFAKVDAQRCSYVVQSPGFRPDHQWVKMAVERGKQVVGEVDLGLRFSDHLEIVAITGTNGKTSLTSILGYVADNLGISCMELGNIGVPLSEAVANRNVTQKIIFHETSSFQSITSKYFNPDYLLWTNFSSAHLDYHKSEKEYFLAKLKLANSCLNPENVFIGQSVLEAARKYGLEINSNFQTVSSLTLEDLPETVGTFHQTVPQLENLSFAMSWFEQKGIAKDQFWQALQGYRPHSHRLTKVTEINDISFWNDSKSTNLDSALAACKSFPNKIVWIGGGKNKGQDLKKFCQILGPYLKHAVLIGESADELMKNFSQLGVNAEICESLKMAIFQSYEAARQLNPVLFSPGFASFDMFFSYIERGNSFEALVFDLKSASQVTTKNIFK